MQDLKRSDISVKVTGRMSEKDAGKIAVINAWRELLVDVIGKAVLKLAALSIAAWKGGDLLAVVIGKIF